MFRVTIGQMALCTVRIERWMSIWAFPIANWDTVDVYKQEFLEKGVVVSGGALSHRQRL